MTFSSKTALYSATALTVSELRNITASEYTLSDEEQSIYDEMQEWLAHKKIVSYTMDDHDYHFKFAQIASAPYIVYGLGNMDILNRDILGIVGPRKISQYGQTIMSDFFDSVTDYDLVTVSGLADGVDTLCHELSMAHNIPTIAILGGGLRHFLRSTRRSIIKKIIDAGGLVLSEFKIDMAPTNYSFPQRNRIIAGLSDMLFLPEAGTKSGSLITVDFARKMKKPIYGAPNDIYATNSAGLLEAMQEGVVTPVASFENVLDQHFATLSTKTKEQSLGDQIVDEDRSEVVLVLQKNPDGCSVNELVHQTELSTPEVMAQLSMAEVLGQVRNTGGVWKVFS